MPRLHTVDDGTGSAAASISRRAPDDDRAAPGAGGRVDRGRGDRRLRRRRRARVARPRPPPPSPPRTTTAPADEAPAQAAAGLRRDRFDSSRAWEELVRQVELGPRPAGSDGAARPRRAPPRRAPEGALRDASPGTRACATSSAASRAASPRSPSPRTTTPSSCPGFVGANDGAAGTAVVMELARALRKADRPENAREIRFLLFDGEEATDDSRPFEATGLRGSTAYAKRHDGELKSLDPARLRRREGPADLPRGALRPARCGTSCARPRAASARRTRSRAGIRQRDHRRSRAVPRARRAGDRPHPVALRLLAPALRRPRRRSRSGRSTSRARRCTSSFVHSDGSDRRSREAAAGRAARLLRGRRPRRPDRRARARAARRARLRAQGDRPQQARRGGPRRARRDLRRRARPTRSPRARSPCSPPTA